MMLSGEELEVLVYPSDVAISGSKTAMARARAAIAVELTESPAYLTTSAESQEIEDAIAKLARRDGERPAPAEWRRRLEELDVRIARLAVPFDEWETVYRQRLQVERELLAAEVEETLGSARAPTDGARLIEWVAAAAVTGLLAADAVLALKRTARARGRSG
jgi:hypothetical protein